MPLSMATGQSMETGKWQVRILDDSDYLRPKTDRIGQDQACSQRLRSEKRARPVYSSKE